VYIKKSFLENIKTLDYVDIRDHFIGGAVIQSIGVALGYIWLTFYINFVFWFFREMYQATKRTRYVDDWWNPFVWSMQKTLEWIIPVLIALVIARIHAPWPWA